jgi:hypothetical protein
LDASAGRAGMALRRCRAARSRVVHRAAAGRPGRASERPPPQTRKGLSGFVAGDERDMPAGPGPALLRRRRWGRLRAAATVSADAWNGAEDLASAAASAKRWGICG